MEELKISVMNVGSFIDAGEYKEVTSTFITESSSAVFDRGGLFSEAIFGELGSPDRLATHGYISLNTTIFHPKVFDTLMSMKRLYGDIISGSSLAIFDTAQKDFVKADIGDKNADTGYSFFMKHATKIDFGTSESVSTKTITKLLLQSKKDWFISHYLVVPAGLREYREKDGRAEYDEINKFYRTMLETASTMKGADTDNPIFDSVRFGLQNKAAQIFGYLWDMYFSDTGFMQKKYAARSVARATRNVLIAMDTGTGGDNPDAELKTDEVAIPLFQAMAMFMPLFKFRLKAQFFDQVFSESSNQVSLIDPKTYALQYVDIGIEEKAKYVASDKLEDLIGTFQDESLRHLPVTIMGADKKPYFLYLTYVKDGNVYIGRSLEDLKVVLKEQGVVEAISKDEVAPLTYYEMYYQACYAATRGKYATITRYPITAHLSIFPAKVHITTTTKFEKRNVMSAANVAAAMSLPRYPIKGSASMHGVTMHPAQLSNTGAD